MGNGIYISEPRANDPLSAGWARDVARALRAGRLNVLPPLALTSTPSGTTLRLQARHSAPASLPRCWDIAELTASSIKLTRCHFMRGPVTVWGAADLSCSLSGSGDVTVAAKIDTEDNSMTLVTGVAGTAWDTTADEASKYYLLPRYVLTRARAGDAWGIALDCRDLQQLGIHV